MGAGSTDVFLATDCLLLLGNDPKVVSQCNLGHGFEQFHPSGYQNPWGHNFKIGS